ncbi:histone family protein DNA-binding protein [Podospora didyma]|uniref:Histone family protein DNA-binding protein n=1 Tax=Podospora didyma TaxID=330526 RepID=A0AAE0TV45_9PEZI|nr:histone family protein DNA-binding protein [Podospora didyma]
MEKSEFGSPDHGTYAGVALEVILHTMEDATKRNDPFTLMGFGTWEVRDRAHTRKGLNPRTKDAVEIPQLKTPIFKSVPMLKKDYETVVKKRDEE